MHVRYSGLWLLVAAAALADPPQAKGTMDKQVLRKVVQSHGAEIRACYAAQLKKHPALEGKVAVRFRISASGSVAFAEVAQSTVANVELESCIVGQLASWVFPAPIGGGEVLVTYPFEFKRSSSTL